MDEVEGGGGTDCVFRRDRDGVERPTVSLRKDLHAERGGETATLNGDVFTIGTGAPDQRRQIPSLHPPSQMCLK